MVYSRTLSFSLFLYDGFEIYLFWKSHLPHFECSAIGEIEPIAGKYKFTRVNIYPKIYIAGESLREKAETAIQKTQQYCLISNSINAAIIYHSQVLTEHHSLQADPKNTEEETFAS